MARLFHIAGRLMLFAHDDWSGQPSRAAPISFAELVNLALAHVLTVLVLGVGMCGLAAISAIVLKSVL